MRRTSLYTYLITMVGLFLANYLYEYLHDQNWGVSMKQSFTQFCTLVILYINSTIINRE